MRGRANGKQSEERGGKKEEDEIGKRSEGNSGAEAGRREREKQIHSPAGRLGGTRPVSEALL